VDRSSQTGCIKLVIYSPFESRHSRI
jgi:hypothetical protein